MATKKKVAPPGDYKSPQLAAAAVDQSAELVQAQAEPLQSVALEQAAEAQGVNLVAEHQTDFDAAAKLDPALVEQTRNEVEQALANKMVDAGIATFNKEQPDWLLGQFDVKAKSPAGFWRCEVQFLHSSQTRVFVVTAKADVPHDHSCEIPCCYLTAEQAQRVYHEPWLVCTEYEVMGG